MISCAVQWPHPSQSASTLLGEIRSCFTRPPGPTAAATLAVPSAHYHSIVRHHAPLPRPRVSKSASKTCPYRCSVTEPWNDESWQNYRDWADKVSVILRFVADPTGKTVVEEWAVHPVGAATWPQDWLVRRVEELGHAPDTGEPRYFLSIRENKLSWGGDSSSLQVVMDVAVGLMSAAAWEGLRKLASDLAGRMREVTSGGSYEMTETEVEYRANWLLGERYDLAEGDLRLTAVECSGDTGSVEFVGSDGTAYVVELYQIDGLVFVEKVRRQLQPPAQSTATPPSDPRRRTHGAQATGPSISG